MNFEGKVVLITGASRGIGRECARQFALRGARVAIHYRGNHDAARQTLESLKGEGHLLLPADIADPAAVERMVETVVEEMGRVDILVNNAGIFQEHPLPDVSYDEWQAIGQRILSTNLVGAANTTYCVARQMIRQGTGGRIVTISSRTAFRGKPEAPLYAASKAALNAMSQSLAVALAPHKIYIAIVAPGVVATDMAAGDLAGPLADSIRNQSPMGRVATPEDVAYTTLFLASEGAEYLTGTIVDVNGASYLRS
ncbi:MAG: SDR family NAD(P)-dependent oxidoreductase [Chloroflexota bacterium]|nr:MAG: 3-oxoacyl-ACP reductase [Chloroflexota bacterium]